MHDYKFPRVGNVSLPSQNQLPSIKIREVKKVADRFAQNIDRALSPWGLYACLLNWMHSWGSSLGASVRFIERTGLAGRVITPMMPPLSDPEEIHRAQEIRRAEEERSKQENERYAMIWSSLGIDARMLDELTHEPVSDQHIKEISQGIEAVLSGMIVGAWTAFETTAGDLWETAVNVHPAGLAELKGRPVKTKTDDDLESEDGERKDNSGTKHVQLAALARWKFGISRHMGSLLRTKFNFNILAGIQNAYSIAWWDERDREKVLAILKHSDLDLLQAIRNLLVFRSWVPLDIPLGHHARPDSGAHTHVQHRESR